MPVLAPNSQNPMLYPGAEEQDPAMEFAKRYRAMMQQAGMLQQMQPPQPSPEDVRAAEAARRYANAVAPTRAFAGRDIPDPDAAYAEALKARMAANPAAMQYAHEAEQAKAMREMTSPDLIAYMGALAGGSRASLPDFLAMQRSSSTGLNDFQIKMAAIERARMQQSAATGEEPKPLTEEDIFNIMRGPQTMMMGGVGYTIDPVTKMPMQMVSPEQIGANAGTVASGEQSGAKVGAAEGTQIATTKDAIWGFESAYNDTEALLSNSKNWLDQIESGNIETGPINAWLYNTFGMNAGNVAGMKTSQIAQGLKDLQTTNLAPVSNVELALIMQMWANIASGKDANRATLEEAIRRTKSLQSKMVTGLKTNANRLKRLAPGEWEDVNSSLGELPLQFLNDNATPPPPPGNWEEPK